MKFRTKLYCIGTYLQQHTSLTLGIYFGLQAINSLKNVESTALLQFLQPILNMLLHLIGDGGETLQVITLLMFQLCKIVLLLL